MSMAAGLPGLDRLDMHGPHGCEAYLLTTEEIAVKAFLVLAGIGALGLRTTTRVLLWSNLSL